MARPARFTIEQLQQAALVLLDEQGPGALTMRGLAAALGTGAMTIYNYVATREALEVLVVDAVAAGIVWPEGPFDDWRDELRAVMLAFWRAVRAHPASIPLLLTRRARSPAALRAAEALLAALARGGLRGAAQLHAFRTLMAYLMGMAQAELAGPLALRAGESADETIARFRALPAAQFPQLRAAAASARHSTPEAEFRAGLELLLRGLEATA